MVKDPLPLPYPENFVRRAPKARVVHPQLKGCRSAVVCVRGPVEELPMKTRPDGSAFRRSNVAYGRLPTIGYNARSEASEHAFARRVIPRQDPITSFFLLRRQLTALLHPNSQ